MIEMMYDVKDRVAVVTGSSRGIGKQCALAFAEAGAKMVLNYVSNKEAAEITAEEIEGLGGEAIVVQADVKDFESCLALGEEAISKFGKIDFTSSFLIKPVSTMNELSFVPIARATKTEDTLESTPPDIADITLLIPTCSLISLVLSFINFPGLQLFLQDEIKKIKFDKNLFPNGV